MPSRTPVPGTVPKTKSKEAEGPQVSGPRPIRDCASFGRGPRWGMGNRQREVLVGGVDG